MKSATIRRIFFQTMLIISIVSGMVWIGSIIRISYLQHNYASLGKDCSAWIDMVPDYERNAQSNQWSQALLNFDHCVSDELESYFEEQSKWLRIFVPSFIVFLFMFIPSLYYLLHTRKWGSPVTQSSASLKKIFVGILVLVNIFLAVWNFAHLWENFVSQDQIKNSLPTRPLAPSLSPTPRAEPTQITYVHPSGLYSLSYPPQLRSKQFVCEIDRFIIHDATTLPSDPCLMQEGPYNFEISVADGDKLQAEETGWRTVTSPSSVDGIPGIQYQFFPPADDVVGYGSYKEIRVVYNNRTYVFVIGNDSVGMSLVSKFRFLDKDNSSRTRPDLTCTKNGGVWMERFSECENISRQTCETAGGRFNECFSPCRHAQDPTIVACIQLCVPVCSF